MRVVAVDGPRLTLNVDHIYGWLRGATDLIPSRTFALNVLWEKVWGDTSTPLGRELAGPAFFEDEQRSPALVGRLISCVGMIDRRNFDAMWRDSNHDGWYADPDPFETKEVPSATYLIAMTDPRWLSHLTPGREWDSTAYDQDEPVAFNPSWRTRDVAAIARGIDADLAFDRMPILADALQDAGCDSAEILDHCRGPGPHVRGCWCVDLVLGNA
jgi:hypothetical protein